jgi:hypothetical protein
MLPLLAISMTLCLKYLTPPSWRYAETATRVSSLALLSHGECALATFVKPNPSRIRISQSRDHDALTEEWPFALHILGHVYNGQLEDARFLWKRIPPAFKQASAEQNYGLIAGSIMAEGEVVLAQRMGLCSSCPCASVVQFRPGLFRVIQEHQGLPEALTISDHYQPGSSW